MYCTLKRFFVTRGEALEGVGKVALAGRLLWPLHKGGGRHLQELNPSSSGTLGESEEAITISGDVDLSLVDVAEVLDTRLLKGLLVHLSTTNTEYLIDSGD